MSPPLSIFSFEMGRGWAVLGVSVASSILLIPSPKQPTHPSFLIILLTLLLGSFIIPLSSLTPVFGASASEKPFDNFVSFYHGPYTREHLVPADQNIHILLFFVMLVKMVMNPNMFVAWVWSLSVGAVVTRALLSVAIPWAEASLIIFVGSCISRHYGVMEQFLFWFNAWMLCDFLTHNYVGMNGSMAIFIGENYLSWGLISQGVLFVDLIMRYLGFTLTL